MTIALSLSLSRAEREIKGSYASDITWYTDGDIYIYM